MDIKVIAVSLLKYRYLGQCLFYTNGLLLNQQNTHVTYRFYRSNPYETLKLKPEATQQEIKDAYIQLSKQIHPDVNNTDPHAHIKFTELTKAYDLLSNPKKRILYDFEMKFDKTYDNQVHRQNEAARKLYKENYENAQKNKEEQANKIINYIFLIFIAQVFMVVVSIHYSGAIESTKESHQKYKAAMYRNMQEFNEKQKLQLENKKDIKKSPYSYRPHSE